MAMKESYRAAVKIRAFEELILDLFGQNKLSGTTHTYIGQEATAVAIMKYVKDGDFVFSNHRCHGHYLAYGGPERALLAEIMSRESGLCHGKGGSQHIHYKNFFTNGIQGGIVPNATGVALAGKLRHQKHNTVVFLGDGTLGQGVVYESMNIAAVYSVPIVYVVEDNAYAMSTRRTDVIAGDIRARIQGFGVETFEIESTDVDALEAFFARVFDYVASEGKPACAVVHNYRLGAHSKGDDTRDPEEVNEHRKKDPILLIREKADPEEVDAAYREFRAGFEKMERELEQEPVLRVKIPTLKAAGVKESLLSSGERRYVEGIRSAFMEKLKEDETAVFLGEDIRDPYGGPFKATKGLSEAFDRRILNMPISEACMTGLCVGLAINGILPVMELMFGDFITLGFDQLLNHASKYGWVYDVQVPMILRVPSGAKRGYGPTHSQSLEKFLIGVPGVKVLSVSQAVDPEKLYRTVFSTIGEPTVIVENKKLYGQKSCGIQDGRYGVFSVREFRDQGYSTILFTVDENTKPDCVLITYGGMLEDALSAAEALMLEDEIQVNVILLTQLNPLPMEDLKKAIRFDVPVLVAEEGTRTAGIGAEIIAQCAERGIGRKFGRIATPDMPIPNGIALESQVVPDCERIKAEIRSAL